MSKIEDRVRRLEAARDGGNPFSQIVRVIVAPGPNGPVFTGERIVRTIGADIHAEISDRLRA